jgi:hypothetical protein
MTYFLLNKSAGGSWTAYICLEQCRLESLVVHLHANLNPHLLDLPLATPDGILHRVCPAFI